jgi:Derlin-2/3
VLQLFDKTRGHFLHFLALTMSTPEEWYKSLPVVTRYYFTIAFSATVLTTLGVIPPYYLYLDWNLVIQRFQIWRLITCFLYFGGFSIQFVFQMYILVKYTRQLESEQFPGLPGLADMLWMYVFNGSLMLALAYFLGNMFFLGSPLVFSCLYVWSRKDPTRAINFYGFAFKAWQFPFVLLAVGMLLGNSPFLNIVGIVVGHCYHFIVDVVPTHYRTRNFLKTPDWLVSAITRQSIQAPEQAFRRGRAGRLS